MEVPPSLATSRVSDLVARCLELLESSGPAAVEALLESHREEALEVRARLQQLSGLGLLAADGAVGASTIPERLGPFRLLEQLGAGGMGVVYLARDEALGREVALKLVRPDLLLFGNARERFRREIEAIARLRHPAILAVYSAGEEGGIPYFAMEYVDGCSLADALARLSRKRPAELSGELLSSVLHERARSTPPRSGHESSAPAADLFGASWIEACLLHRAAPWRRRSSTRTARRCVHRDVKPSNVMLARDGRVLLLRLRPGGGRRGQPHHAARRRARLAALHGARAAARRAGRRARRRLLARHAALRAPRRCAARTSRPTRRSRAAASSRASRRRSRASTPPCPGTWRPSA